MMNPVEELDDYINKLIDKRIFLICGNSIKLTIFDEYLRNINDKNGIKITYFTKFNSK